MSRSEPSRKDAVDLTEAAVRGFGKPCDCHAHGMYVHQCDAHTWLTEDPTQRGLVRQWQRLLWVRELTRRGLYSDASTPAPTPAPAPARSPDPTRLPW